VVDIMCEERSKRCLASIFEEKKGHAVASAPAADGAAE
jgi:hypothetical protein